MSTPDFRDVEERRELGDGVHPLAECDAVPMYEWPAWTVYYARDRAVCRVVVRAPNSTVAESEANLGEGERVLRIELGDGR